MPQLHPDFLRLPISHRGLHGNGRVENSLSAIQAAIDHGFAIEIDVQESADGVAMVFHDDTLDRLTQASGPVRALLADQLTQLTLRDSTDCIPRLTDVLALVAGRVPLLIEIKDQSLTLGPLSGRLEQAIARDLAGYGGPVAVMSFNPDSMAHMARLAPDVSRGLVTCAYTPDDWPDVPAERRQALATIPDADRVGAVFLSHHWRDLGAARVAELAAQGLAVLCWTIRSPEQEGQARTVAQNITFEGYTPA